MRLQILLISYAASALLTSAAAGPDVTADPKFTHPAIERYGGIVSLPRAAEQPKKGAKILFDLTAYPDLKAVVQGLDQAALVLNQYADAGVPPEAIDFAVVLHGDATKAVLTHEAYAKHTKVTKNPNLELLESLRSAKVDLFVCGQALAHHRYGTNEVLPTVTVAASAVTVNVNKQMDGYAYIPFP